MPQDVLAELPVALNRSEIYSAAKYSAEVRAAMNDLFSSVGRDKYIRPAKSDLWERVLERPNLVHALLDAYDAAPAQSYDFVLDPAAESGRLKEARTLAAQHPLELPIPSTGWTGESALTAVKEICLHFKKLVEHNGLWETLWVDPNVTPLKEKGIQRIFFGVAVTYCRNGKPDLDISPEVNSGPGPVDFKFSHGAKIKVNVEMKKSDHARLLHGYQTQLERYNAAEDTDLSIYLIIRTSEDKAKLEAVQNMRDEVLKKGKKAPEIIIVDARPQKSASKA